jgi:hypothetical protein
LSGQREKGGHSGQQERQRRRSGSGRKEGIACRQQEDVKGRPRTCSSTCRRSRRGTLPHTRPRVESHDDSDCCWCVEAVGRLLALDSSRFQMLCQIPRKTVFLALDSKSFGCCAGHLLPASSFPAALPTGARVCRGHLLPLRAERVAPRQRRIKRVGVLFKP